MFILENDQLKLLNDSYMFLGSFQSEETKMFKKICLSVYFTDQIAPIKV